MVLCLLWLPGGGPAEVDPSTQQRIEHLENENRELRTLVEELQRRLEAVEKRFPSPKISEEYPTSATRPLQDLDRRVQVLEDLEEKFEKGWLRSLRRKWLELGGEIELEYRDTQRERHSRADVTEDPYGQFQIDHVRLSPRVRFTDDLILEADFDAGQQATSDLQEVYLLWRNLPLHSELTIGQQKKFFRPDRKTESYPLAGTAFWHDRDLGVSGKSEWGPFYSHLAVMNGLRMDDDEIGEDESFPILADDLEYGDSNANKEISAGLGWKEKSGEWGKIDLMLFGVWGELSDDDEIFLLGLPKYRLIQDGNDRNRYGANLDYQWNEANLFFQYITSDDGGLERDAWYLQSSYRFKPELKYLLSVEPLVRYGELNLNLDPVSTNSRTWDRRQWTVALIMELVKDVFLRTEYTINDEETGADDIRNDEALIQLELRF
ncbi:MAG TPA: hypothetical protein PLQ35_11525 [bacterium]|nr:hypothetical protein [bacterium]HQL62913.1 hypothetical protein [bacterium]